MHLTSTIPYTWFARCYCVRIVRWWYFLYFLHTEELAYSSVLVSLTTVQMPANRAYIIAYLSTIVSGRHDWCCYLSVMSVAAASLLLFLPQAACYLLVKSLLLSHSARSSRAEVAPFGHSLDCL